MALGKQMPDKQLQRAVDQKLIQRGSGTKVRGVVSSGTVTLSGELGQDFQRKMILSAMNGISGIKRVIDTMTIAPKKKRHDADG